MAHGCGSLPQHGSCPMTHDWRYRGQWPFPPIFCYWLECAGCHHHLPRQLRGIRLARVHTVLSVLLVQSRPKFKPQPKYFRQFRTGSFIDANCMACRVLGLANFKAPAEPEANQGCTHASVQQWNVQATGSCHGMFQPVRRRPRPTAIVMFACGFSKQERSSSAHTHLRLSQAIRASSRISRAAEDGCAEHDI